jgi:chromosome segregation ATPase
VASVNARLEELERLVLRGHEQIGELKEENWALQQRLEEASRAKAELERECAVLIKEMRALRLQLDETDGNMERLRAVVRQTEQQLNDTARESEEGSLDIAKLRMCNAELHGRVGEGELRLLHAAAALEEEKTLHIETQRKLRDAMSMLEKARGEQRELVQAHTKAIEEQHSKDAQELKRQGAEQVRMQEDLIREHTFLPSPSILYSDFCVINRLGPDFSECEQVRKAEDRIRELQREVVAKEDQRAAMARHAEALEKKLVSAQEEARAYLKTVEGTAEQHKKQQLSKDDTMRKVQERVQELEREIMERNAEHKRELDRTSSDLLRAAHQEKEKYVGERREAERKLAAAHRAEMDKLQQTLRAQGDGEVEKLRALLREEQLKSDTRVAALEEVNRETQARAENVLRSKLQASEADSKAKVDKALAEANERTTRMEKSWREQLDKSEQLRKGLVATLEKDVSDAKVQIIKSLNPVTVLRLLWI